MTRRMIAQSLLNETDAVPGPGDFKAQLRIVLSLLQESFVESKGILQQVFSDGVQPGMADQFFVCDARQHEVDGIERTLEALLSAALRLLGVLTGTCRFDRLPDTDRRPCQYRARQRRRGGEPYEI